MTLRKVVDGMTRRRRHPEQELIDYAGIAALLDVDRDTPKTWRKRSRHGSGRDPMPGEVARFRGPVFRVDDVVQWARESGRLPEQYASDPDELAAAIARVTQQDDARDPAA